MPRDSAGVMTLPPTTWATTGQTISVNQHNPPMREIEQALTDSLPRNGSAGMTGDLPMAGNRITGLGAPVQPDDAVSLSYVGAINTIGMIVDYAGDNAPDGWMLCYGQAVSRTTYSALFAVIGTKFGSGNGTTTFNLPDYRGRVGVGKDNMGGTAAGRMSFFGALANTIGGVFGAASHVLTLGQMPKHNHGSGGAHTHTGSTNSAGDHTHTLGFTESRRGYDENGSSSAVAGSGSTGSAGSHTHTVTINSGGAHTHNMEGNNEAHINTQPSIVINKIIRVK